MPRTRVRPGGITYDYLSLNPSLVSVNGSGVVTAPSACPGAGLPCSVQVLSMAEASNRSGTDLTSYMGTAQYWSTSHPFFGSDIGRLVKVSGGGGSCSPGIYQIASIDLRVPLMTFSNGSNPGVCAYATFETGPTAISWFFPWPTNTMPCIGSDGLHASYTPACFYMHSAYSSSGFLGANFSPTYNYAGGANNGPQAEFDLPGVTWELGIMPEVCGDYASSTLAAFQSAMTTYVAPFAAERSNLHNAVYMYYTGDNIIAGPNDLWACTNAAANPPNWTTPIVAQALDSLSGTGFNVLGGNLADEGAGIYPRPLAGPITPGGANSWLASSGISCNGTTCTVTGNGSQLLMNVSNTFIIHGSIVNSGALNTAPGGAGYVASSFGGTSFTFPSTVPAGTYCNSADTGCTIEPFASNGYVEGSNTSYVGYDAFANIMVQSNLQSGHAAIAESSAYNQTCYDRQTHGGLGTDGPIHGISQFGNNQGPYQDFFPDDSQYQSFLNARNSLIWNMTGPPGPGGFTRAQWGCYSPSVPLVTLTQADETSAGLQGYPVSITSITGNVITFAVPHSLQNVVPGDTRLSVTGNSNSPFNTDYYVLAILSPTQITVATPVTTVTANATNCALTFTTDSYVENPSYFEANGSERQLGFFPGGVYYGTYGLGQSFGTATPDPNLPKHRGAQFIVSGCSATSLNGLTGVYATTNLNVPSYNPVEGNIWWQVLSGTGTGGTAVIIPDNSSNCGRAGCLFPSENDPAWVAGNYMEAAITGAQGFRGYKQPGPAGNTYQIGYGYTGFYGLSSGLFPSGNNIGSSFAPYNSLTNQFYTFAHWENAGNVPIANARLVTQQFLSRWQKPLLQPRFNSPSYGQQIDCTARGSSGAGNILLCWNGTNSAVSASPAGGETRTFNLATACGGASCIQTGQNYVINIAGPDGTNVITTASPGTTTQTVTLQAGQWVAFVFPTTFAGTLNQPAYSPCAGSGCGSFGNCPTGTTEVVIQHSYNLYLLGVSLQNADVFTSFPATLSADKNYGTVWGIVQCVSSTGGVLSTSDVQTF